MLSKVSRVISTTFFNVGDAATLWRCDDDLRLVVSLGQLLGHQDVKYLVGNDRLEFAVLRLELFEFFGICCLHTAIGVLPPVPGCLSPLSDEQPQQQFYLRSTSCRPRQAF